jgi:hypothetical protein
MQLFTSMPTAYAIVILFQRPFAGYPLWLWSALAAVALWCLLWLLRIFLVQRRHARVRKTGA